MLMLMLVLREPHYHWMDSPLPYVPSPCILSRRECECECERAAPLMLIPRETSGNPADEAAADRLGEPERCCDCCSAGGDFDVAFRPSRPGRWVCPIRNSSDGVSPGLSVIVLNRFILEARALSSVPLAGADATERTGWCGGESLRLRRWRSCCPLMDSFCPPCRSPSTSGSARPALRFPRTASAALLRTGSGGGAAGGGGFAGSEIGWDAGRVKD
ncbi:hypothetical protein BC827DRAFT_323604 [Russula dissimulans]|nr:hypothetical protein BC827DRAFT_323604 [Russula dissimulans]